MIDTTSQVPERSALLPLLNTLLRRRGLVFGAPLGLAGIVVVIGLLLPRTYTASASFAPQSSSGAMSRLTGLAAQFGIAVPTDDPTQSPDFYADLLQSGQLLRAMVESTYVFESAGDTVRGNLVAIYDIDAGGPGRSREEAVKRLGQDLRVSSDLKTGVVTLSVEAKAPELARQLAERALALVNSFNLRTRQTQAAAERLFVEGRMRAAEQDLRAAEDRLQAFLTSNRNFSNSPQLQFEHDRIQREVQTRQDIYTNLAQGYEQARISEVRNTPVITVIEGPILPVKPDSRRLALKALLALLIGGGLAALLAVAIDYFRQSGQQAPDDLLEFRRLREEFLQQLRHPVRSLRRTGSRDEPSHS
jgi:uncharacterized protein involved in exopolysaccharide biosynthesis